MVSSTLFIGFLAIFNLLTPGLVAASSNYATVEQLSFIPNGWVRGRAPSPSKRMRFHLAMPQGKGDELEKRVLDLSTPGHPSYGHHMKRENLQDYVRPSDQAVQKIRSWLDSEHVPAESIQFNGNWVTFTVPVSTAESMLRTKFYQFSHMDSSTSVIRTLGYSVPEDIYPYVQLIQPTTRFAQPFAQSRLQGFKPVAATFEDLTTNCTTSLTPDCLRELYGIFDSIATPDPRNRLGISGFLDQYARHEDLKRFLKRYAPNRTDTNFTVVSINGGLNLQNSTKSSAEASLDVQYAVSLAYNTLATYYSTGGRAPIVGNEESTNEPYLEQLRYLLELPDDELPAILSTSYGEEEQTVPTSYANATCNLFAQLGARGVSVIFSSGDSGIGDSCVANDGSGTKKFQPIFPASCPFVTSVGGTYGMKPEKAIHFSAGGFSEVFPRPLYQEAVVDKYVRNISSQWDGWYNPHGRAFPDVSAQSSNFIIMDHGTPLKIGGTSAAAPVFSAIISMINAARLKDGKPRMGFLNPWLYSLNQTGLTDIVDGGSTGCFDELPYAGWNATEGWDPVTGLGTPFYNTLVKVAKNL